MPDSPQFDAPPPATSAPRRSPAKASASASPGPSAAASPSAAATAPPPREIDRESADALAAGTLAPTDEELEDMLPDSGVAAARDGVDTRQSLPAAGEKLLIHFVADGFTAHGRVWYRGQELEYTIGDEAYQGTCNRDGQSWLAFGDAEQMRGYGKVMFRRGPWPGNGFEDSRAREREQQRRRTPPVAPTGFAGRR